MVTIEQKLTLFSKLLQQDIKEELDTSVVTWGSEQVFIAVLTHGSNWANLNVKWLTVSWQQHVAFLTSLPHGSTGPCCFNVLMQRTLRFCLWLCEYLF